MRNAASARHVRSTFDAVMNVRSYGVYVIEIDGHPKQVYVGHSAHSPEARLAQHLARGRLAAKVFKRGATGKLRPDLYQHIKRFSSRPAAEQAERALASELRAAG